MVILIFLHFYSSFVIDHWDCKRVNVIPSMRQLKVVIIHCVRGEYRIVTRKREQHNLWDFLFCVFFFTCNRNKIMIPNDIVPNTLEGKPRSSTYGCDISIMIIQHGNFSNPQLVEIFFLSMDASDSIEYESFGPLQPERTMLACEYSRLVSIW